MSFLDDLVAVDSTKEKETENLIHTRFSDTPWMKPTGLPLFNVSIVGIGNIGSWLALYASRTNINQITIMDHDKVEAHNIGGQLYSPIHINKFKVHAIKELASLLSNYTNIIDVIHKFETYYLYYNNLYNHVLFSCVDNMKTRKELFTEFLAYDNIDIFIDGRSNAEHFQVFAVRKDDLNAIDAYKNELFDDDEVEDTPCNFKSTSHCGSQLASIMWAIFLNHVSNKALNLDVREVPFKIEVNLMNMLYDVTIK